MPTSHGTKVTPSDAPTTREGAGVVTSDSLAAESVRSGGAFAQNRNIHETDAATDPASTKPSEVITGAVSEHQGGKVDKAASTHVNAEVREGDAAAAAAAAAAAERTGGGGVDKAPSYVDTVLGAGKEELPHGKNVTEDEEMMGRPAKVGAESIGAEEGVAKGPVAGGGAPGGGDAGRGGAFDKLGSDAQA